MGRKARFRRVSSMPITLHIDGVPTRIPPNGTFISTVEMMGSLPGIRFEGFVDAGGIERNTVPQDVIKEWSNATTHIEQAQIDTANLIIEPISEVTPQVTPQVTPEVTQGGFDPKVLAELKLKDNRAWMVMTKKEIKATLTEANIDFSQVKDDRNQLYKFLAGIVKSL